MQLQEAIQRIARKRCILFLGAGFSLAATNSVGTPVPTAPQLADQIASELGMNPPIPLAFAIDQLRRKRPADIAFEFIRERLVVSSIMPSQEYVLNLPWRRIYTTNIDTIGSNFSKRNWLDAAEPGGIPESGDFVYLHGAVANSSIANFSHRLRMGEQSYLDGSFSNSTYHHQLRQDLYESDAVFVIGYGLADPDLYILRRRLPSGD